MKNRYFFLRHGYSVSNDKGIICSTIENGTLPEFGLLPEGMKQIATTAEALSDIVNIGKAIIFTSPFTRALQSALITKQVLGLPHYSFFVSDKLIERNFKSLELESSVLYESVWTADNNGEMSEGVESCIEVSIRISDFVDMCESRFDCKDIIVVSHGDVIMISRTLFLSISPFRHRDFPYIKNAEYILFDKNYKEKTLQSGDKGFIDFDDFEDSTEL
jgi:broad specificity phosphatase PhoE